MIFSLWWTSCLYEGEVLQMAATALLLYDACVLQGEGFHDTQKSCVLFHALTNLFVLFVFFGILCSEIVYQILDSRRSSLFNWCHASFSR